jgi:hypothetical protein
MSETSGRNYLEKLSQVEEGVDKEIPGFKALTPKRKMSRITNSLKLYIEKRRSADRYNMLEKKNPNYKSKRIESEYFEMLASTRFKKEVKVLTDYELELLYIYLNGKLQEGLIEPYTRRRFDTHELITTACSLCDVDNKEFMVKIKALKEDAMQIIRAMRA